MTVLLRFLLDVCNQYSGTDAHVIPFYRSHEAFKTLLKIKMALKLQLNCLKISKKNIEQMFTN